MLATTIRLAIDWPLLTTAGLPEWVWAALLMALFAGMSVLTIVALRFPSRTPPPPFDPPDEPARDETSGER